MLGLHRLSPALTNPHSTTHDCAMPTPASAPNFADLEAIERDAWTDFYAAAPDAVRQALRVACRKADDGVLLLCGGIDHIQFNRLAAVGLREPARIETIEAAIASFTQAGLKNWIVQAPEQAAGLAEACARCGLQPHPRAWVKFHRPAEAVEATTRLTVREATTSEAQAFGATAAAAFGMPAVVGDWLAALVGRPRWHCFLALDGDKPAAAGTAYIDGAYAWLGIGGTLPSHRRLGGQSALLAARIRRAAESGCTWTTTETGLPQPGEAGPSYRNIQRAGFGITYVRPNLTRPA
jgi:GNAT superfamily N-acetyltransferase